MLLSTPSLGITQRSTLCHRFATGICFQLPLSGSRHDSDLLTVVQHRRTFNSLSRDHCLLVEPETRNLFPLSTPSLGITDDPRVGRENRRVLLSTPSLGITWQPCAAWVGLQPFQLPLSGSLIHLGRPGARSGGLLSTPSLGITKCGQIRAKLVRYLTNFQLPLSGSPSPIPGFSGSPRLSAAAALRTNDS